MAIDAPTGDVGIRRAFTLIELVTVIVILGVLSATAIPVYLDYALDAKKSACRGALGGLRSAIASYYARTATPSGGGSARFPTLSELTTIGTVMGNEIPPNPFDSDATPNNVVDGTGVAKGTVIGTAKGWCYNPTNGQIWANSYTKSAGENSY
ncbi:MAG: hypothetical protein HBSAPP02_20490 [Phycisphaerae bacterium]|nr:MAG: prepilin-type N-terminal cleavage/methylation domain-containing protein [Planctomycetia bacterium]RIK69968.1 MAG: hypothetical protein DCC66_07075 [Planctomycetota bacterium]GJQ27017.1 MAG: hypothetical protein HBSAPP02_20490 [Phycisphaerae bacterium]